MKKCNSDSFQCNCCNNSSARRLYLSQTAYCENIQFSDKIKISMKDVRIESGDLSILQELVSPFQTWEMLGTFIFRSSRPEEWDKLTQLALQSLVSEITTLELLYSRYCYHVRFSRQCLSFDTINIVSEDFSMLQALVSHCQYWEVRQYLSIQDLKLEDYIRVEQLLQSLRGSIERVDITSSSASKPKFPREILRILWNKTSRIWVVQGQNYEKSEVDNFDEFVKKHLSLPNLCTEFI